MIAKKENIFALVIVIVDFILEYKFKASFSDPFTFIPLVAFAIIFYANYMSQFSPAVLGERGRGTGTWYKNTYLILSLKSIGWLILALPLLVTVLFIFK